MSDLQPNGPKRSLDLGSPGGRTQEPRRERSPEQKAADAQTIADNLGRQDKLVRDSVTAMAVAADAADRAAWTIAKQAADAGVAQIRDKVKAALAAATDATDAQVRACLAGVDQLLTDARALVAGACAAPEIHTPVMTCADALLAALPPLHVPPPVEPIYAAAERGVDAIFRNQMTRSDIWAFEAILREHQDHEIARRFGRFGPTRQTGLLAILDEDKVKAAAQAREAAQQRLRRGATPRTATNNPTSAGPAPTARAAADVRPLPTAEVPKRSPADAANVTAAERGYPPVAQTHTDRSAPTAELSRSGSGDAVPTLRLDKTKDAQRLHALVALRQQEAIVELLEHNAHPEHMYALHRAYGSRLVPDVQGALTEASYLARARVYLGEQMTLDARIGSRGQGDAGAIFDDLERVPDARVLALFEGDAVTIAWAPLAPSSAASSAPEPAGAWLPETTTLAAVKQALHGRLGADDYYRAMRLLLAKADRAIAVQRACAGTKPPPGMNLDGLPFTLEDLTIGPANPDVRASPIALPPVSAARVDLTEARIREADAADNWIADPMKARQALVALADLDRTERRAMALRLRDRPLTNALGGMSLGEDALEIDDAKAIQTAILNVQTLATLQAQAMQGVGFDVALERAGELVRSARARLAQLPPNAPEAERTKAQAEVQRLEAMFSGPGSPVLEMLRAGASRSGDSDGGAAVLEAQLRALGADSVTVATEQLRAVPSGDAATLIATLRKVATENRLAAMQRAGHLDALSAGSMRLTPDQGELVSALLWQGAPPVDLGSWLGPEFGPQLGPATSQRDPRAPQQPPASIVVPPGLGPPLLGPRPELVIALHDILDAMGKGAAHEVLGRLTRMSDPDQHAIYADPRYRARRETLPAGKDGSPERHFKDSLELAEAAGARWALLGYPAGDDEPQVLLEAMGAQAEGPGQASLRRGYVLIERLGGRSQLERNRALLDTLSPEDRTVVEWLLGGLLAERDAHLDDAKHKEAANQIIFGQPQLADTPDAALDPTMEAEFMYFRLRDAAGIRGGVEFMDSFNAAGPSVDESVAEFMVLYQRVRPGGVDRGELAQLAELYHRATRRLDTYRKATDSFASSAAQVVGAVVTTVVVTIASGGTLGPVAVGAMATLSGAAAAAATGASIRIDNTVMSVLKDAGTGAIEGIAAAAGASLAARIVRGATMGISAGRAAATVGAHAAGHATGGLGASIAEAMIDGAIGGAAGELFQTATDEATWDRGIAEAFSALLAAIARGAATGGLGGAAIGGVVGGLGKLSRLAARLGDATAHDVGRLLEAAGVGTHVLEHLSETAEDQLARVVALLRARQLDEAERALAALEELPAHARAMLASVARVRVMMDTVVDLGPVDLEGILVLPRIVDDRAFRKLAGGRRGDAVVLIEHGQPQIVMRQGASASALREELTHLAQWKTDPMMRQRMAGLGEDRLAHWEQLPAAERLERHLDKLEVEADAQRRIIDQLDHRVAEDPEAATAVLDAEETLFELGQRIDTLRAVRGQPHLDAKALGIDEVPRLFARGAQTPPVVAGRRARRAEKLIGQAINDPTVQQELSRIGYKLARTKDTGRWFRISRRAERYHDLPHLTVDEDTGIVRAGEARRNFPERREDAARRWRSESEQLSELDAVAEAGGEGAAEARRVIAGAAPRFRAELERRIAAGTLDEGGAGMLARWGKVIGELDRDGMVPLQELIATLPRGPLTEAAYDGFRHVIRRRTVDALMAIEDPAEQVKTLYKMIELQPESASKGHLFTEYRRDLMTATTHEGKPLYDVDGKQPRPFDGSELAQKRRPDDVVQIRAQVEGKLPPGRYAIEDKAGDTAFKPYQAEAYARRSVNAGKDGGGFKLTPESATSEYDGLVYVFSREREASNALDQMRDKSDELLSSLLGKHPGGIHVMYLNANTGTLELLTEVPISRLIPTRSPTP